MVSEQPPCTANKTAVAVDKIATVRLLQLYGGLKGGLMSTYWLELLDDNYDPTSLAGPLRIELNGPVMGKRAFELYELLKQRTGPPPQLNWAALGVTGVPKQQGTQ